ncbi:MAG: hypothetical protein ACI87W_002388 [Halieaceae bacterium]|jgi:hypothetical protein
MISRRESLALAAGVALSSVATGAAQDLSASYSDAWTHTPDGLLRGLMKLRAALDGRMTLEWFQGVAYGVVDSAMLPLFTVNAVAFAHYRLSGDGVFNGRRAEVTYHTSLDSKRVLERFENPYNGETVDVPMSRTPNQDAVIGRGGLVAPERVGAIRIESESSLGPGTVNAERSWVRLDTRTRLFMDSAPTPMSSYGESITYAGSTRDILDTQVLSAPCQISYTNVMNWRPWMKMGELVGHTTTVANGEKVESLAALPRDLRMFVEQHHPDLAQDPRAALALSPTSRV